MAAQEAIRVLTERELGNEPVLEPKTAAPSPKKRQRAKQAARNSNGDAADDPTGDSNETSAPKKPAEAKNDV
jgi:hypothetical protein